MYSGHFRTMETLCALPEKPAAVCRYVENASILDEYDAEKEAAKKAVEEAKVRAPRPSLAVLQRWSVEGPHAFKLTKDSTCPCPPHLPCSRFHTRTTAGSTRSCLSTPSDEAATKP